jgi:hypothetical protein
LFPAFDSGEDAVGICGPDEGFWFGIGFQDEAVDSGLVIADGLEDAANESPSRLVSVAKKVSNALSQDAEVAVKWKVQRECRASHSRTLGCLWVSTKGMDRLSPLRLRFCTRISPATRFSV